MKLLAAVLMTFTLLFAEVASAHPMDRAIKYFNDQIQLGDKGKFAKALKLLKSAGFHRASTESPTIYLGGDGGHTYAVGADYSGSKIRSLMAIIKVPSDESAEPELRKVFDLHEIEKWTK